MIIMTNDEIIEAAKKFENAIENFGDWPLAKVKDYYYNLKAIAMVRGLEVDL
jgi:hypothetical protein